MATTTKTTTVRHALNEARLNQIADALALIDLGNMLSRIKVVFTGLSSSTTQDITTAAAKAAATITGINLDSGENLPPIGQVVSLRGATGTGAGTYVMSDAGGTAVTPATSTVAGVALLSDNGKVITFPVAQTAFTLVYYPAPAVDASGNGTNQPFPFAAP